MRDGETHNMIGTMKITNMKSYDRQTTDLAKKMLEDMPHGVCGYYAR